MCAVPFNDLHKNDLKLKDLRKIQRLVKERLPTGAAAAAATHSLPPLCGKHLGFTALCDHFLLKPSSGRQTHIQHLCYSHHSARHTFRPLCATFGVANGHPMRPWQLMQLTVSMPL